MQYNILLLYVLMRCFNRQQYYFILILYAAMFPFLCLFFIRCRFIPFALVRFSPVFDGTIFDPVFKIKYKNEMRQRLSRSISYVFIPIQNNNNDRIALPIMLVLSILLHPPSRFKVLSSPFKDFILLGSTSLGIVI